jgi:hypothetical protein
VQQRLLHAVTKEYTKLPKKGFSYEKIAETGEMLYTPMTSKSPYFDHRIIATMGLNSAVNAPIYLNGSDFYGCLNAAVQKEDAFSFHMSLLTNFCSDVNGYCKGGGVVQINMSLQSES